MDEASLEGGRQRREEESMKKVRQKDERIWAKGR